MSQEINRMTIESKEEFAVFAKPFNRSFAISQELLADSFVDIRNLMQNPPAAISAIESRANRMQENQDEIDSLKSQAINGMAQ